MNNLPTDILSKCFDFIDVEFVYKTLQFTNKSIYSIISTIPHNLLYEGDPDAILVAYKNNRKVLDKLPKDIGYGTSGLMMIAAGKGIVELLDWGLDHEYSWSYGSCCEACLHGHISVLEWADKKGYNYSANMCHFDKVADWIHKNGWACECPS